ncbi:MAG: N-acetyltransferase family protein [Phycisphaerae bacterium]
MGNQKESKALRIRLANERDTCELVSLENECFDTYYRQHRFSKTHFTYYIQNDQVIFLVAILNSSIIGYVAGSIRVSRFQPSAHLDSIAVSPLHQRRGIGSQLMQRYIEEAKQQDCTSVILEVAVVNKNGVLFFAHEGFEKVRMLRGYYGEGLDGILMKLDLSSAKQ